MVRLRRIHFGFRSNSHLVMQMGGQNDPRPVGPANRNHNNFTKVNQRLNERSDIPSAINEPDPARPFARRALSPVADPWGARTLACRVETLLDTFSTGAKRSTACVPSPQ